MKAKTQNNIAWGLEFGGSVVRLIRVTRDGGSYRADSYAEAILEKRWQTPPNIAAVVRSMGVGRIDEPLVACIGDEMVLFRTLSLPDAPPEAMESIVAGQLEVLVPTRADEFTSGYHRSDDPFKPGSAHVLLCAARRSALAGVTGACRLIVNEPVAVVPSMLALAALWTKFGGAGDEPTVLLDVAARCTSLAVVQGGRVLHCGVIDNGGDQWTERIAEQLKLDCGEAETRKLQGATEVQESIRASLGVWARQLRELYQDCIAEIPRQSRPRRCVLFGGAAAAAGLVELTAEMLGVEVDVWTVPNSLAVGTGAGDGCAAAIGAAISAMQADSPAVSLIATAAEKPQPRRKIAWMWAALMLWVVAGVFALYAAHRAEADHLSRRVEEIAAKASRLGDVNRQLAIGRYLDKGGPTPLEMLDRISSAVPRATLLSRLSYHRDGNLTIAGTVANNDEFLTMVEKLGELGRVEVKSAGPDKKKFRFDIHLKVGQFTGPATTQPTSQPSTQPTTAPASQPATKPAAPEQQPPPEAEAPATQPPAAPQPQPTNQPAQSQTIRRTIRVRRTSEAQSRPGGES